MPLHGDRLREIRRKREHSQEELAELVKTTRHQIGRYELGQSEPSADMLARLANILGCSADYLVGLSDEETGYGPEIDPEVLSLARRLMQFPKAIRDALIGIAKSMHDTGNYH